MIDELTNKNKSYFFSLDIKDKMREKPFLQKQKNKDASCFENEWFQEYEMIYLSQKYENWNLEEPYPTENELLS